MLIRMSDPYGLRTQKYFIHATNPLKEALCVSSIISFTSLINMYKTSQNMLIFEGDVSAVNRISETVMCTDMLNRISQSGLVKARVSTQLDNFRLSENV